MNKIMGFLLIVFGTFVSAMNITLLYPNPEYEASWNKVVISFGLAIVGGTIVTKNKE
jgi:hypothetical protein